ncbi:hypothetical protein PMIN04_011062 [Paraphaeosphaeria minitans]
MATCTRCLYSLAKTPSHRTQWRRIWIHRRLYSSDTPEHPSDHESKPQSKDPEDAEWFQTLRNEMLNRELPLERDAIEAQAAKKLDSTLFSFFPKGWQASPTSEPQPTRRAANAAMPHAIGEHLIFCNPALSDDKLLPDGTDQLHSPGGSFVRRMWAGGAVRVNKNFYFDENLGWALHKHILCFERIKDVRLRGQGEKEKIFITIERKFARYDPVFQAIQNSRDKPRRGPSLSVALTEQMRNWNQAFVTEDRNIVFMRERSAEELEDIKAGNMAPVKYLQSLGEPDFSHTLTPTSTLLARFSFLTFNAHLIHLDGEFARNVEGHRNLLVHGPLTQTLLLKFIGTHSKLIPEGPHIVETIEYKNLAPLYCGEELRLCAKEKIAARMDDARMYDVWIEGPTGGMAVKGLVRTVRRPTHIGPNRNTSSPRIWKAPSNKAAAMEKPRHSQSERSNGTAHHISRRVRKVAIELDSDTTGRKPPTASAKVGVVPIRRHIASPERKFTVSEDAALTVLSPLPALPPLPEQLQPRSAESTHLRKYLRALRLQSRRRHRNVEPQALRRWLQQVREHSLNPTDSPHPGPLMRAVHVPIPMRVRMKPADRNILQRTLRLRVPRLLVKPIPVVRYHEAAEEPAFERWGVRHVAPRPEIKYRLTEETREAHNARKWIRSRAAKKAARTED